MPKAELEVKKPGAITGSHSIVRPTRQNPIAFGHFMVGKGLEDSGCQDWFTQCANRASSCPLCLKSLIAKPFGHSRADEMTRSARNPPDHRSSYQAICNKTVPQDCDLLPSRQRPRKQRVRSSRAV
jgi:hypothetical protein